MNKFLSVKSQGICSLVIGLLLSLIPSLALATGGGTNPVPVPNPELKASCGFDIALVLDSSGSISTSELNQMKNAFNGFVDAFLPGTATLFSVTDFDASAQILQKTFTDDLGLIHIAVNTPVSGGSTNWADGLNKALTTFDPRTGNEHPNLIVFASDGNPNRPNNSTDGLNAAITKANEIKNSGTRIIALGIGDNLKVNNLKAISSADAVYTSGFDTLAADLSELATELCGGTVTVKKLIDQDNNLSTTDDQLPGTGWTFEIEGTSNASKITGANGFTEAFEIDQGTYSVREVAQNNFKLLDAECSVNNAPAGSLSDLTVSDISVDSNDIVSCVFINHENQPPVIVLDGPNPHNILVSENSYDEPGFSASDLEDGDLTSSVVVSGTVDTPNPGTYVITYNVVDNDGVSAVEKTRTVNVSAPPSECSDGVDNDGDTLVDFPDDPGCINEEDDDENAPPVITLTGSNPQVVTLNGSYSEEGATADDAEDGNGLVVTDIDSSAVNTSLVGTYTVYYNFTDSLGAAAAEVTRSVFVKAACSDGIDNDSDNAVDSADPGCHSDADPNNPDSYDQNDNDETNPADVCANLDGIQIVVPQGLISQNGDCVSPPSPICSDGLDNDEDGLVDELDPGCHTDGDPDNPDSYNPNDDDETNVPVPSGLCEDDQANNEGAPLPCTYNDPGPTGGGGGSRSGDFRGGGAVLGAATFPIESSCFYLRDYMRIDLNNDPMEVVKLQAFLINFEGHTNLSLSGVFDQATFEAVSEFQVKYFADVLEPWGHTLPTGYVYILTLKKINEIYCQRIFPLNEAQVNEIAAFKGLLDSLRARGINPELPSSQGLRGADADSSATSSALTADKDESRGLGAIRGLAMAVVANPENINDLAKTIYGLLVFVIALYILGNVLKDVFYKNIPANLRKRFLVKWLVIDLGLVVAIVTSLIFDWWFVLPLMVLLALSLFWTSLYPEHNSIRASIKSWYLVLAARAKSVVRSVAQEPIKEVAKEPVAKKEVTADKVSTEKVIVMGPKK